MRWDLPCMVYTTNYRSSVKTNVFSIKNLFIALLFLALLWLLVDFLYSSCNSCGGKVEN